MSVESHLPRNWRLQSDRYQLKFTKPKLEARRDIEKYDFNNSEEIKIDKPAEANENGHNIIPLPPQRDRVLTAAGD